MFFAPSKSRKRSKIWLIDLSKTSDIIQMKIKMPNPRQEPLAFSKAPNEYLTDIDVLYTFIIKIESIKLQYGRTKDQWRYPNEDQDAKPHSETPASSKAKNQDLKDMYVFRTF